MNPIALKLGKSLIIKRLLVSFAYLGNRVADWIAFALIACFVALCFFGVPVLIGVLAAKAF